MKSSHLLAGISALAFAASAGATSFACNMSAIGAGSPLAGTFNVGGGLSANGCEFKNQTAGLLTYIVTPVNGALTDATNDFLAANRFSTNPSATSGWEWGYWVQIGTNAATAPRYQVGFGAGNPLSSNGAVAGVPPPPSGVPVAGAAYQSSALAAFNLSSAVAGVASHSFSLGANETGRLLWLDNNWGDNNGGISVNVTVVPEPEAYGLALAGMGVVALAMRRRRTAAT